MICFAMSDSPLAAALVVRSEVKIAGSNVADVLKALAFFFSSLKLNLFSGLGGLVFTPYFYDHDFMT